MKDATITVRILAEHKEQLQAKAVIMGMSVSEYLRMLALKDLGIIK
jgi:antitoxin component of RelBE/YafQ-DinJ toxin-antitoxin module